MRSRPNPTISKCVTSCACNPRAGEARQEDLEFKVILSFTELQASPGYVKDSIEQTKISSKDFPPVNWLTTS